MDKKVPVSFAPEGKQRHQVGGVDSGVFVEVGHFPGKPGSPGKGGDEKTGWVRFFLLTSRSGIKYRTLHCYSFHKLSSSGMEGKEGHSYHLISAIVPMDDKGDLSRLIFMPLSFQQSL